MGSINGDDKRAGIFTDDTEVFFIKSGARDGSYRHDWSKVFVVNA